MTLPKFLSSLVLVVCVVALTLAIVPIAKCFAVFETSAALKGSFDGINNNSVLSGWAFDPMSPSTSITISIYMDGPMGVGKLMNTFTTSNTRADVNASHNITGTHGFSWPIPAAYQNQIHLWYVYGVGLSGKQEQISGSSRIYPAVTASAIAAPEPVFTYAINRCDVKDIPDNAARAYRDATGRVNLIASHYEVHHAVGSTLDNVVHQCAIIHNSPNDPVFGHFKYHEWLTSPYTLDGNTVYGYMHSEWYGNLVDPACGNDMIDGWVNAITFATSHDGGTTFSHPDDYLVRYPTTPWSNSFPCSKGNATRYGDFGGTNIIAKGSYYYKFFAYHSEPAIQPPQFGECLMRTEDLSKASSWEVWNGNGFVRSKTEPCALIPNILDAQSVTYNTYLKLYVITTYEKSRGFYFSVSPDLINWSMRMPIAINGLDTSHTPYPSLLDPMDTSRNFENTGQTPFVYYTLLHDGLNRDLMRVQIGFSMASSNAQ